MNDLTVSQLAHHHGAHPQTIRRWCRNGTLTESHSTLGNHRRFTKPVPQDGIKVGYVRVSSQDQKECLATQNDARIEKARLLFYSSKQMV